MQQSSRSVLLTPSYEKVGFKDLHVFPRQHRKWKSQNTRKGGFLTLSDVPSTHSNCQLPHSQPSSSLFLGEILSLNSLPQTFCALNPYQAVTGSPGQTAHSVSCEQEFPLSNTRYDVYQWRIPFSREELLITEAPGLQIPKRPSTCLCVSAQPSTEGLRCLKVYKQDVN